MSIGHSPHVGPHIPDMQKDAANITEGERQEARRRIEGSLAPDMGDGMGIGMKMGKGKGSDMGDLPEDTDVADAAAHGGFAPDKGSGGMSSLNPANIH